MRILSICTKIEEDQRFETINHVLLIAMNAHYIPLPGFLPPLGEVIPAVVTERKRFCLIVGFQLLTFCVAHVLAPVRLCNARPLGDEIDTSEPAVLGLRVTGKIVMFKPGERRGVRIPGVIHLDFERGLAFLEVLSPSVDLMGGQV